MTPAAYGPVAVSLALLVACYWPTLYALSLDWIRIDTAMHGFPVLLFVVASLWRRRGPLAAIPRQPWAPGFLFVIWGGAQAIAASLGVELFLGRTAFLIALAGVVLFHLGWRFFREIALLWFLLCLAVPLPAILYNPVVGLLQSIASTLTEFALSVANIPLHWEGTAMQFAGGMQQVRPVEGYGALRLAMALAAAPIAYGEWFARGLAARMLLPVATMALGIGLSSLRICVVAWLDDSVSPGQAMRVLENAGPWLVLSLTLLIVGAVDWWLAARMRGRPKPESEIA